MMTVNHSCRVCGAFGMYGFGVHLRKNKPGEWYCGAHKPAVAREAIKPAPYSPQAQGRLL